MFHVEHSVENQGRAAPNFVAAGEAALGMLSGGLRPPETLVSQFQIGKRKYQRLLPGAMRLASKLTIFHSPERWLYTRV